MCWFGVTCGTSDLQDRCEGYVLIWCDLWHLWPAGQMWRLCVDLVWLVAPLTCRTDVKAMCWFGVTCGTSDLQDRCEGYVLIWCDLWYLWPAGQMWRLCVDLVWLVAPLTCRTDVKAMCWFGVTCGTSDLQDRCEGYVLIWCDLWPAGQMWRLCVDLVWPLTCRRTASLSFTGQHSTSWTNTTNPWQQQQQQQP